MKHIFSRSWISALMILLLLTSVSTFAEDESIDFHQAMQAEVERWGDVYTWSFEKKADFYNTYRYHGVGTRRGVPCDHVLQKDVIIDTATHYLLSVVSVSEEDLAAYIIDVDYWIDAFPDEDREHEYYTVLFAAQTAPHEFRSAYQLMISPYSGDILECLAMDDHRE